MSGAKPLLLLYAFMSRTVTNLYLFIRLAIQGYNLIWQYYLRPLIFNFLISVRPLCCYLGTVVLSVRTVCQILICYRVFVSHLNYACLRLYCRYMCHFISVFLYVFTCNMFINTTTTTNNNNNNNNDNNNKGTTENSHIRHCTHTLESVNIEEQWIQRRN